MMNQDHINISTLDQIANKLICLVLDDLTSAEMEIYQYLVDIKYLELNDKKKIVRTVSLQSQSQIDETLSNIAYCIAGDPYEILTKSEMSIYRLLALAGYVSTDNHGEVVIL